MCRRLQEQGRYPVYRMFVDKAVDRSVRRRIAIAEAILAGDEIALAAALR